jgi:hypothetical protein
MEQRFSNRKALFKNIDSQNSERRRQSAETQSDEAKRELLRSLRESVSLEISDFQMVEKPSLHELRTRKIFSRSFMYPDTMVKVPVDLDTDWMVSLRPEGQRCLAVLSSNTLTMRQRNGQIIDSFVLDPFSIRPIDGIAIFDCVYGFNTSSMERTVYVSDILLFKGNELVFSDFTFRQYFLKENWPFLDVASAPSLMGFEDDSLPSFVRIESVPATRDSISRLYFQTTTGVSPDSLLFHQKDGKYINGLSGDFLMFRDSHLSRFAIDSSHQDGFDGAESMDIVLRAVVKRGKNEHAVEFKTWDGVVLYATEEVPGWIRDGLKKRPSLLVRCSMSDKFEFMEFKSSGKPFPNSVSRIVDQFRKRRLALGLDPIGNTVFDASPLTFQDIVDSS